MCHNKDKRMISIGDIRQKLAAGEASLGGWILSGSAAIAEAMAMSGAFDWISIDMEHSATTIRECESCIRAIERGGCVPLVRTMQRRSSEIDRYLDAGAGGMIFADVRDHNDAADLKKAVTYRPDGDRSFAIGRSAEYGEGDTIAIYAATRPLLVLMIEHVDALAFIPRIAEAGPDALMLGPFDLSASAGTPADFGSKAYQEAAHTFHELCSGAGVTKAIHNPYADRGMVADHIASGYRFIGCGMDTTYVAMSSRDAAGVSHKATRETENEV